MPEVYQHPFTADLQLVIVYPDDPIYETVKGHFERTHAFLIHEDAMVVVDGDTVSQTWFTSDHLLVVAAHEMGHWLAGHSGASIDEEKEADWLGWRILLGRGETKAANLHVRMFRERYGAHPNAWDARHLADLLPPT